jgi:phosphatidate phosphatase APP1
VDGPFPIGFIFSTRNGVNNKEQFQAVLFWKGKTDLLVRMLMPKTPSFPLPNQPASQLGGWRTYLLNLLRLSDCPVVKVYRGFGTATQVTVQGQVLRLSPLPQRHYQQRFWVNLIDMLRQFMIRPIPHAQVQVMGTPTVVTTDADGFFRFDWQPEFPLSPGWHPVQINLVTTSETGQPVASGMGEVFVPHSTQYGIISDIDDTFLVSHSSTKLKRLGVLLFRNAHGRRPFAGVVAHYQALSQAGTTPDQPNPFFYVSSSEWNLYDYLLAFLGKHDLPTGVLMLSQLKQFSQLRSTGQNKHFTKLDRIARILAAYPQHQFILLGDDTQADPDIYANVVKHHAAQIRCVYLRQVGGAKKEAVATLAANIETAGVPCCYVAHSAEAMQHSTRIGLI